MTVIVAVKDIENGKVWIGADKNYTNGSRTYSGSTPKIWKETDGFGNVWGFGVTGTTNLKQIAQFRIKLPQLNVTEAEDVCGLIFMEWVTELYQHSKEMGGVVRPDSKTGDTLEGSFLLGLRGKIYFCVGLSVVEIDQPFHTIGSGAEVAFGALDAMRRHNLKLSAEECIRSAITSASAFDPRIGGGIDVLEV